MTTYFRKGKSLYSSTTNSFGVGESETITPSSVTGLPTTEMVLTFDRTVSGKLERIKGTITGGNFVVSSGGRGYDGTTEQAHTSPTVEYIPNAADMNDIVDGFDVEHSLDGTHDATKVAMLAGTQTLTNKTLTSPKINENVAVIATATEINLLHGKTTLDSAAFWTLFSGAYASGTTITVAGTDVTGIFKKGVVLKWQKSDNTFKTGMVVSSSFSTDTTITIIGSTVEGGDKNFYYGGDAFVETFIIPGTLGAATDIAKTWYCPTASYPLGCDAHVKTAGTTNATEFDINDDGTTLFNGTAASIASGATSDLANTSYTPATVIAADSIITVDINSVSTTAPVEAYLQLYYYPQWWVSRT